MKRQQRYAPEFRAEAVKLVTEQGLSQEAAANRLSIPKGTLAYWIAASKATNHRCPVRVHEAMATPISR
jgi:transposase